MRCRTHGYVRSISHWSKVHKIWKKAHKARRHGHRSRGKGLNVPLGPLAGWGPHVNVKLTAKDLKALIGLARMIRG